MYWNGKANSVWGSTLPKIWIVWKNARNKSCGTLNFVHKSQWVHMSISLRSGARGLRRLICLVYYIVLKWKSRFSLGLDAPRIRIVWENVRNKSFPTLTSIHKSQWAHMSIPPRSGAGGLQRLIHYFILKWKSRFSLELDAAKNTNYMRRRSK